MKNLFFCLLFFCFGFVNQSYAAINLTITGSVVPNSMFVGTQYTVTYTIQNTGSTSTSTTFYVNVSINSSTTYNGSQTYLTDIVVNGISANSTKTVSTTITIPSNYATGTKYILASVNPIGARTVVESTYSDNDVALSTLIKTLPDLLPVPSAFSISPSTVAAGNNITATFNVQNTGTTTASNFYVGFYLSSSSTLNTPTAQYLDRTFISSLGGNSQTGSLSKTLTIPTSFCAGSYYIHMFIDYTGAVTESTNSNNYQHLSLSIQNSIPTINNHPTDKNALVGGSVSFGISYSGIVTTLQWQVNTGNGWNNITSSGSNPTYSGWNITTLSVSGVILSNSGYQYRCLISNSCVTSPSNSATLSVSNACTTCSSPDFLITPNTAWQTHFSSITASCWKMYRVPVTSGYTYTFKTGCGDGATASFNTYLTLLDNNCSQITSDDDACGSNGPSKITWTATNYTGYVYLKVAGYLANSGNYTLAYNYSNCNQSPPSSSFSASPTTLTAGYSTTLSANSCAGCTYTWQLQSNTGASVGPITLSTPNYSPTLTTPGTYNVTLTVATASPCSQSVTQTLNAYITVNGQNTVYNSPTQKQPATYLAKSYPKPVAADPVNLITGLQEDVFELIKLPIVNGGLDFKIFYNGAVTYTDAFLGNNRRHSFDYRLINQNDEVWTVRYPDLHETQFIPYYNNGNTRTNSFSLNKGVFDKLTKDPNTGVFTFKLKNQLRLNFNSSGELTSIIDRNDNIIVLNYSGGKLISVIGTGGRGLNFLYTNNLLTQVSTLTGESVNFNYTENNLTGIYDLENHFYEYSYNATNQVEWVKKPKGNYLYRNEYNSEKKISKQWDGNNIPTEFIYDTVSSKTILKYLDNSLRVYQYDSLKRVVKETDEEGLSDSTIYNLYNIPTKHFDRNGISTSFTVDTVGNITDIYLPKGQHLIKRYNTTNDLLLEVNAKEDSIKYQRDLRGNPIKTIFPDKNSNRYVINNLGQTIAIYDAKNNRIDSLVYNSLGDTQLEIKPFGSYMYGFDSMGRKVATTDPLGKVDSTIFNKLGLKIRHRNADNQVAKWQYDVNNNEIEFADYKNIKYTKAYDLNDQLIEEFGPQKFHNKIRRNFRGFIVSNTNSLNDSITFVVDKRGYVRQSKLNTHPPTINTIDNEGNILSIQDPLGKIITNTLDSLYRNTKVDYNSVFHTQTQYDNRNLPVRQIDGNTNYKSFVFNRRSLPDSVYDELSNPTVIKYDANSNPIQIIDAEGNINVTGFDIASRDTSSTDGDNKTIYKKYYSDGTVEQIKRPDNSTIGLTYTNLKQPETIAYSGGQNYTTNYDFNGNKKSIVGPLGTETFGYDSLNHPIAQKDVYNNTITHIKNALGLPIKTIYPDGKFITTSYNEFNKPDTIALWNTKKITYEYDHSGHLRKKRMPDGTTLTILRDSIYRVTDFIETVQNGATTDTLYHYWCRRDGVGDIDTFYVSGKGVLSPLLKTLAKKYTYKPNDALVSDSLSNFTSSANGATIDQKNISGHTLVQYDFIQNDLLSTLTSDNTQQTFLWNGLEKMISITTNGKQTKLVQDCTQEVAQLMMTQNAQGDATGYYIHGYGGPVAYVDSVGKFFYYHLDIFGNTAYLTDDEATITDKYAYDLFGTRTRHDGTSPQLLCTFAQHGAIFINDSLVCIQSRFLQTTTGRFLSKDRAAFNFKDPFSLHRFIYANNDPVGYYDLSGWGAEESTFNRVLNGLQTTLDVAGLFPVLGAFPDLINSIIYSGRGDPANAAFSLGAAIPGIGDVAMVGKMGLKGAKYVKEAKKVEEAAKTGKSFFEGTEYSEKVLGQIKMGDFHGFPELVKNFELDGIRTTIKGGDDVTREMLKIPGGYGGKEGVFEFIKESDGLINHRLFRPN